MRTVDLIHRKRDGEELSVQEIAFLVDGYTSGAIPDYQMSAFLMATFFSGMTDREVSARLFTTLVPRFKERPGGYTRIIHVGPRPGDAAPMAIIELVD